MLKIPAARNTTRHRACSSSPHASQRRATTAHPPAYATLAATGGSIDAHVALAYPPLANDFIQADRNRDGKVPRAEHERWLRQP